MLIVITGSRTWRESKIVTEVLSKYPPDSKLIHGGAMGADRIAGRVAEKLGMTVEVMEADWERYGKSAGFRRNDEMLDRNPDVVVAFWDGKSRGTKYTIDEANKRNIQTVVTVGEGKIDD
jgi:hypothetical protein